jgi:two-component system, OmpR family, response regulator
VKSVLRRTSPASESALPGEIGLQKRNRRWFAQWCADLDRQEVSTVDGEIVGLTSAEYKLLTVFIERPQRVLSRDALLKLTHAENSDSFDRSVDVLVSRLRTKFGDSAQRAKLIRTVRGGGYMFVEPVSSQSPTSQEPTSEGPSAGESASSVSA